MKSRFAAAAFLAVAAVGLGGFLVLRAENERLQRRVIALQGQQQRARQFAEENTRLRDLVQQAKAADADAARAIHAERLRVSREVERLEAAAEEKRVRLVAGTTIDAQMLASNRDPERGLVRLEHFSNHGQGTPSAAFQTFVWAAMQGKDDRLASMIVFPNTVRDMAASVLAELPASDRASYQTPEALAALFFADAITSLPAAEITSVKFVDAEHAILGARIPGMDDQKIPLQLGTAGWQITMSEKMVEKLRGWSRRPP